MPEIGEVARIVHFLRKHLVSRTITSVKAFEDTIVYGKVGTSAEAFANALEGKTVLDARQQGKYFWLVMDSPPHPLMHFGMSGWMKFTTEETFYYSSNRKSDASGETVVASPDAKATAEEDEASALDTASKKKTKSKSKKKAAEDEPTWPPKYAKFILDTDDSAVSAAFVDARRLARIRLVDVPAEEMRKTTPLKENGPDPVIDADVLTVDWLKERLAKKRVPIKAYLLEQSNISGIGNWVGDEILYNARIHPEQYSNTLSTAQVEQLHKSMMYVCGIAVGELADSKKFPEGWLFKHRWNKGKKGEEVNVLPNGEKIVHVTVGGRTSAIVPSLQKKTGPVAGDADAGGNGDGEGVNKAPAKKKAAGRKRKVKEDAEDEDEEGVETEEEKPVAEKTKVVGKKRKVKEENEQDVEDEDEEKPVARKTEARTSKKSKVATDVHEEAEELDGKGEQKTPDTGGRRRSGRKSKA